MTRDERVEGLLARDRELRERMETATPDELPAIQRQRKQVKSQMNLYGPAAVERLLREEFSEFFDEVEAQEEARQARQARWAKHPELLEKIKKLAVG
jgi:hypothetical protein